MRNTLLKLNRRNSTSAERKFAEILKKLHIPFQTKVMICGREVDFLIGKYTIDIDGRKKQDGYKNAMLAKEGFVPIHISNKEVKENGFHKLSKWCIEFRDSIDGANRNPRKSHIRKAENR